MNYLAQIYSGAKILLTRKVTWEDVSTKEATTERVSFDTAWRLAGPQPYRWWWVRKYGKQKCGCTINPVTRRRILISSRCEQHGGKLYHMLKARRKIREQQEHEQKG